VDTITSSDHRMNDARLRQPFRLSGLLFGSSLYSLPARFFAYFIPKHPAFLSLKEQQETIFSNEETLFDLYIFDHFINQTLAKRELPAPAIAPAIAPARFAYTPISGRALLMVSLLTLGSSYSSPASADPSPAPNPEQVAGCCIPFCDSEGPGGCTVLEWGRSETFYHSSQGDPDCHSATVTCESIDPEMLSYTNFNGPNGEVIPVSVVTQRNLRPPPIQCLLLPPAPISALVQGPHLVPCLLPRLTPQ